MRKIVPFLVLFATASLPAVARSQTLILPEEAALPAPAEDMAVTRGLTRGPGIEIASPAANAAGLPLVFPFKVTFVSRNQVPIDPASVRVTYVKAKPVDLTERVKPALSASGIDMSRAEAPPGTHVIRLEVKDMQGRSANASVRFTVAAPR